VSRRFNGGEESRENAVSKPVVFAVPADLELKPAPIPPHWVIEGNPRPRSRRLSMSDDGTASTMVWVCNPGRFHWNYSVDETLYILCGEVHLTNEAGEVRRLVAGDIVHFPAGSRSIWHVTHEVRKIAFCRHRMPLVCGYALRAWSKLIAVATGHSGGALEAEDQTAAPAESHRVTAA
jgi:uncharacterized cupin superfamily protein